MSEEYNQQSKHSHNHFNDPMILSVDTISALLNAPTSQPVQVRAYYPDTNAGGGLFWWDPNEDKQNHNGGTIMDPDHAATIGSETWYTSENIGTGCWKRDIDIFVKPEQFGCFGDGSTNDTFGFETMLSNHDNIFLSSHYVLDPIEVEGDNFNLVGSGDAILDFTNDTSVNVDLLLTGNIEQISDLSADLSKYDTQVSFSNTHGLQEGDLFLIKNPNANSWSNHRTYYRQGEICKVKEIVDSTTVEIYNRLYDSYVASDINMYKINSSKVNANGFKLWGNEGQGFGIRYGEDVNISDLDFTGVFIRTVEFDTCYGVNARDSFITHTGQSADPNPQSYGINYGCTQNITISGWTINTIGDSIESSRGSQDTPSRNIRISDIYASASISQHGNAEHTIVKDCIAHGTIFVGSNYGKVIDCVCYSVIRSREITGGNFSFINNTIYNLNYNEALRVSQTNETIEEDEEQNTIIRGNLIYGVVNLLSGGDKDYETRLFFEDNTIISQLDEDSVSDTFKYYPRLALEIDQYDVKTFSFKNNTIYGNIDIGYNGTAESIVAQIENNTLYRGTQAPIFRGNGASVMQFNNNYIVDNLRLEGPSNSQNTNVLFTGIDQLYVENNKLGDTVNNTNGSWIGIVNVNNIYMTNNSSLNQESKQLRGNSVGNMQSGNTGRGHRRSGTATISSGDNSILVPFNNFSSLYSINLTGTHAEVSDCIVSNQGGSGFTIQTGDGSNVTADRDVYWRIEI